MVILITSAKNDDHMRMGPNSTRKQTDNKKFEVTEVFMHLQVIFEWESTLWIEKNLPQLISSDFAQFVSLISSNISISLIFLWGMMKP